MENQIKYNSLTMNFESLRVVCLDIGLYIY